MWGFITKVFSVVWSLITGKTTSDAERLGQTETSNAQLKKGVEVIQKADDAAKKEAQREKDLSYDPDNRDDPRNRGL